MTYQDKRSKAKMRLTGILVILVLSFGLITNSIAEECGPYYVEQTLEYAGDSHWYPNGYGDTQLFNTHTGEYEDSGTPSPPGNYHHSYYHVAQCINGIISNRTSIGDLPRWHDGMIPSGCTDHRFVTTGGQGGIPVGQECGDPEICTPEELAQKIQEEIACEPFYYNWDSQTCTGECMDDTACQDEIAQARAECGVNGIQSFSLVDCSYTCNTGCDNKYAMLVEKCAPQDVINWDEDTCTGECGEKATCSELELDCIAKCERKGGVEFWECLDSDPGPVFQCVCNEPDQKEQDSNRPSDGNEGNEGTNREDEEQETGTDNQLLSEVATNTKNTAHNTKAIAENTASILKGTRNIAENVARATDNLKVIADQNDVAQGTRKQILDKQNEIAEKTDTTNQKLSDVAEKAGITNQKLEDGLGAVNQNLGDVKNKLDEISNKMPDEIEITGDTNVLPGDNIYDSNVDEIEEESLLDAFGDFVTSGLPIISYINGTYIQLSNAQSSMSVDIWGSSVTFDLAPMEPILNQMGLILVGISAIVAFLIIIGRF